MLRGQTSINSDLSNAPSTRIQIFSLCFILLSTGRGCFNFGHQCKDAGFRKQSPAERSLMKTPNCRFHVDARKQGSSRE